MKVLSFEHTSKFTRYVFTVIIGSVFTFSLLLNFGQPSNDNHFNSNLSTVLAQDITCPDTMSEEECLSYLQEQARDIAAEREKLQSRIDEESAKEQTISEKLASINMIISEAELSIKNIELEIEAKTLEIKILNKEISELQQRIEVSSNEIEILQKKLSDRIVESYKLMNHSEIDILLTSNSVENYYLRMKYLEKAREKDRQSLNLVADRVQELRKDQEMLTNKLELVAQRTEEIEAERQELLEVRAELAQSRSEQAALLAESRTRINNYWGELSELKQQEDAITATITKLILSQHQSGALPANTPVKKGDIIGFQGYSGFTYGAHLHFVLYGKDPFALGYLTGGGLGQPVGSGTAHAPLDGGVLTQTFHSGYAIDLVSTTAGIQDASATYDAPEICCYGMCRAAGVYSARGTGAPVRAIKDGKVSALYVDACGGKYVIVDHGNGETSLYLHLN